MNIEFLATRSLELEPPVPAKDCLPEWYINLNSYINKEKISIEVNRQQVTSATIKKCMPVFDSITAGYIIKTWSDIKVINNNGVIDYEIEDDILAGHTIKQADGHPSITKQDDIVAKFVNIWGVRTPPGWSCLFKEPSHRKNILSVMDGIVDTDTYNLPVSLPFVLSDKSFTGVIPKGTPIVQIIPIKRGNWEMQTKILDNETELSLINKLRKEKFNNYKKFFWGKKYYR